jgi:Kazal-type serine protease inhibitor domain
VGKAPPPKSVVEEVQLHLAGTGASNPQLSPPPQGSCPCPRIFQQVCASNGVTYDNSCLAACAGSVIVADGPCPTDGSQPDTGRGFACITLYAPVCGLDGQTYDNSCVAEKGGGTKVAHNGAC